MLTKSQIIVLHTIKHGDTGIVVQGYSNNFGRQSLYLRGSSKSLNKISNLHKLNILDVITYNNSPISMPSIKEMVSTHKLNSLKSNIYKSTIALFISELLSKCVKESEANTYLYNFVSSSIQILEHTTIGICNFHIHFITHFCKVLGFMPLDNYSNNNNIFDLSVARFCSSLSIPKYGSYFMDETESKLLHILINTPSTALDELKYDNQPLKLNGQIRLNFTKKMVDYLSLHLGSTLEIKSLDILHDVFA